MADIIDVDWWSKEDQIKVYQDKLADDYYHMLHEAEWLKKEASISKNPELREAVSRLQHRLLRQRDEVSDVCDAVLLKIKNLQDMATPGVPPLWCDKTRKETDE